MPIANRSILPSRPSWYLLVLLATACGPSDGPTGASGTASSPTPTGLGSLGTLGDRTARLRRYDGQGVRVDAYIAIDGRKRTLVSSKAMRIRFDAADGRLRLVGRGAAGQPCQSLTPINDELSEVSACRRGNMQWDPEADTTFTESVSQFYTAAAGAEPATRTDIPSDSIGIVRFSIDEGSEESFQTTAANHDGTLAWSVLELDDGWTAVATPTYSGGVIVLMTVTIANAENDVITLQITQDNGPALVVDQALAAAAMKAGCADALWETAARVGETALIISAGAVLVSNAATVGVVVRGVITEYGGVLFAGTTPLRAVTPKAVGWFAAAAAYATRTARAAAKAAITAYNVC